MLRAQVGRLSCGLSPAGLLLVYLDWLTHAAFSPGKQFELARKMSRKAMKFGLYAGRESFNRALPPPSRRCLKTNALTRRPGSSGLSTCQLLRSNDLIWSRMVREYLLGEREKMTDLMAWNADGTRLPYRMHSEYLRQLFLNNDLAEGRYHAGGRPVALADIAQPIFVVSTVKDHVAPWRSVYKIHLLSDTDLTFVLTTGGHNAGIVTEPGHPRRSFQMAEHRPGDRHPDPDTWLTLTPAQKDRGGRRGKPG